jgi:hypothetical protein
METGGLPPWQRAARYRDLAASQLEMAGRAKLPEISSAHLELAAMWTRLAEEADRRPDEARPARPEGPAGESPDTVVEVV